MSEYEQKSFTFLLTFFDTAQRMNPKNRLAFYDAIGDYIFLGIDREGELGANTRTSQAYFGFLGIKGLLKKSKMRAEAGASIKTESNGNQNGIKHESKKSSYIDKSKREKKKEKGKTETPSACPKCGGVLLLTGIHDDRRVMLRCEACHEEVWCDG